MNIHKTFIFIALFAVLAIPTYAETTYIDAQKWTTCEAGQCVTTVDLTKHMAALEVTNVKATDLTASKPKLDSKLTEFNYKFDGNFLIVSGRVNKNTYWTFDLKNGYVVDPWWNITTVSAFAGVAVPGPPATTSTVTDFKFFGMFFVAPSNDGYFHAHTNTNCTEAVLFADEGDALIETQAVDGSGFFNFTTLLNGTDSYYFGCGSSTETYIRKYNYPYNYPFAGAGLSVTQRATNESGSWLFLDSTSSTDNFDYLYWANVTEISIWYNTSLWLNNTQNSNITKDNSTALNSTAVTNLTGVTVLLWINDTLSGNNTTRVENLTNLSVGLYNITAWFGNASTNDTLTYWANITAASAPVANLTGSYYSYCSDNNTLNYYNEYNYQTDTLINRSTICVYGCDNVTFTCSPPQFVVDLLSYGVVAVFIIFIIWILKRRR